MKLAEHPTVRRFHERNGDDHNGYEPKKLDAAWLRQLCLDSGADDAGLVEISRPALDDQRVDIQRVVELKINFFRPVRKGRLIAEARVIKAGGTLGYVECDVKDQDGKLLARAGSTCMKLKEFRP